MILEAYVDAYWDFALIIGAFSTYTFFLLVYNLLKHMKHGGSFLTAKGIILFITSLGVLQGGLTFQIRYINAYPTVRFIFGNIGVFFFIASMIVFIVLAEIDMVRHLPREGTILKKYPISFLLLVIIIALAPFVIDGIAFYIIILYALIIPQFFYSSIKFTRQFARMRIVQSQKPVKWIVSGFTMSFISLLLNNNFIWDAINNILAIMPFLTSGFMLLGGILMSHGWEHMPNLSELGWLSGLEYLYVIHMDDNILLFEYPFQYDTAGPVKNASDLVGGMIGALDQFVQDALATPKHLTEIKIEGKIVSCTYRRFCAFIVFATSASEEYQSRLYEFADDFEKFFAKKLKESPNFNMNEYEKANPLVTKHFS